MSRHTYETLAKNNRVLLVRTGSHLYGTATDSSDEDREGIFIPPRDFVLGLRSVEHVDCSIEATDERGRNLPEAVDITYYALRTYMRRALKNNPNILELLFANDANLLFVNALGRQLLEARHLFPHKKLCERYLGYARGQRRKLNRRTHVEADRAFRRASHLIRLLKEGIELLKTGALQFPLGYADLVSAVKRGQYSIDEVLELSQELEDELRHTRETSSLPAGPRFDEVNQLTIHLMKQHLSLSDRI